MPWRIAIWGQNEGNAVEVPSDGSQAEESALLIKLSKAGPGQCLDERPPESPHVNSSPFHDDRKARDINVGFANGHISSPPSYHLLSMR